MKAIKECGHQLISVYDMHDGLAILDQFFPSSVCFSDEKLYTSFHLANPLDYVAVCSPNDLHFSHVFWGLNQKAHVICEKPLVLDPEHLDQLEILEKVKERRVFTILQLRLVEEVKNLKKRITESDRIHDVTVSYISARGNWYFNSWKGSPDRSGSIITNIGIHLFDLLLWIFGAVQSSEMSEFSPVRARGRLRLEKANVNWFLSVDGSDIPVEGIRSYRKITVDGVTIPLDSGMENLHTQCYREILAGRGFGISDARDSINLCFQLRKQAKLSI
jgi:UDP-N-acetyl-2-amino-2-deoxyglucuronate dehydrogenase